MGMQPARQQTQQPVVALQEGSAAARVRSPRVDAHAHAESWAAVDTESPVVTVDVVVDIATPLVLVYAAAADSVD